MNFAKKIFFILIFALLFFVPNTSPASAACVPLEDKSAYCAGYKNKTSCDSETTGVCNWDIQVPLKPTCAQINNCGGNDYKSCISKSIMNKCKWSGAIPSAAGTKADASLPISVPKIDNPTGIPLVKNFIGNIINSIFGFVGSIALLMFIYGGLAWMTSGGNAEKVKKSRDTLVWAAIGLVFIFLSYAIASILIRTIS